MSSEVETKKNIFAKPYLGYSFSVAVVGASLLLHHGLVEFLGHELPPFIVFYPTIMIVALLCGLWPGVLATALSSLAVDYWILSPRGSFAIASAADAVALTLFFGMGVFISVVAEANRRNQQRLAAYKSELALRQSEEQFETLANAIPQLCWMANADGFIFWYNRRWYEYTGTTPKQMEGWGWQSVHDPETLPKVLERWNASIVTGEPFDMVFPLRGTDGVFRSFLTRVMPVKDAGGKVVRWFGTNTDISAQRKTEEALRSSQAKLQGIVGSAMDAVISVDEQQRVVVFNHAAELIFQCAASEAIGSTLDRFIPESLREHHHEHLQRFGNTGVTNRSMNSPGILTGLRTNGEEFPIEATISQVQADRQKIYTVILRDITVRKQAEEALQASERRYRLLFESMLNGFAHCRLLYDQNGGPADFEYVDVNPAFGELTGQQDVVGKRYSDLFPGARESNPELLEAYARVVSTGQPTTFEIYFNPLKSWLSLSAYKTQGEYFVVVFDNITERKQAEEALRESQEQFRTLADAIPQLCWIANADGFIFWYNERWYNYTGTTPEQMEGWGWQSVHDPDTLPKVMEHWKASIATGKPFDMVFPLRGTDGVFRPFLTRIMPVKDTAGKVVRWFGTNTDVTELRNAQEALRASEHRWATTLQSIGDAVISTNADGNIDFMNDVAQRLTGWPLPEARGQDLSAVFDIVQEVTRIKPENPVSKVIRLGMVVGLANHTALIRRDGTEIPIEDSGAPIRNEQGQIEGVVLVFHDVSEQRKVEKVLRNSDRLATTGRLAATIAHEIHNPLDAVGNLLFLISQDATEDTTRQYVSMASQELTRVTQMTQQMLAFQREAAKPVPVKIGEVLDSVSALYERKINSAGIQLKQQVEFDGHILALPGELRQVFANLVGNAIEAVGPRRGTITLRAYASHDWRHGQPGLRVVVADNGPGIPADVRGNIFEPFFTTKGESGTGLGLWITSDILRKYDGTMRLRTSTRPCCSGTCFSIFLPFENNHGPSERP